MEAFGLAVVTRSRFTVGLLISALNVLGTVFNMRQPTKLTTSMHAACTPSCCSSSVKVAKHRVVLKAAKGLQAVRGRAQRKQHLHCNRLANHMAQ